MTGPVLANQDGLKRELGVWSAAAIVVGTVIGSGIFLVPSTMVRNVGSPLKVFGVWIAGGLLSLFGALSYAELAAALPEAGGEYVYLREAYGPLWGFLYGWTQMWVAKSGSIATLATGFYIYLANFRPELGNVWVMTPLPLGEGGAPLPIRYGQLLAIALIMLLALHQLLRRSGGWKRPSGYHPAEGGSYRRDYFDWIGIRARQRCQLSHIHARARRGLGLLCGASGGFMGLRRLE